MNNDLDDLFAPCELHDELVPYLAKFEKFEALRHPLVYAVPYFPQMNAAHNRLFEHKTQAAAQALKESDFERYIFLHERPYRLHAFFEVRSCMSDAQYWATLGHVWSDSENIWQNLHTWKRLLKSNRTNQQCFMDKEDIEAFNALPHRIKVYRGCSSGVNENGLSWTTDRKRAVWFARRFSSDGPLLLSADTTKTDVFAYLGGRKESEIVLLRKPYRFRRLLLKGDL